MNIYNNNQFRDLKCYFPKNFLIKLQQTFDWIIVLDLEEPPERDLEMFAQHFL